MESLETVVLTIEQQDTIDQAFKVEHLKDEMAFNKMFDYDFNFDDEIDQN